MASKAGPAMRRAMPGVCEGRSECTIPATNRLCGDPAPYITKVLTVWYRCGNRPPRSTTRWEGRYVGLRCH